MTPRSHIGNTYIVKRADELMLGDYVLVHDINSGMFTNEIVKRLELVGDDVEVNQHDPHYSSFCTSIGNAVMVLQEEVP